MIDWQASHYGPIFDVLGQSATLNATNGDALDVTVVNRTVPTSFMNVAGAVEFQDFRPTAFVRMSEITAAGLTVVDDVLGGELVMDGKTWSIKSYEYVASPVGNSDGQLRLILSDDVDV